MSVFEARGQAGYDVELNKRRLEVRTSLLKDEGVFSKGKNIKNYGWRLKDKGKDINYDYVICVALNEAHIEDSKCYVLTKNEVDQAPPIEVGRFKKVEKRLWIYLDLQTMQRAKRDKPNYVPPWEESINHKKDDFLFENRRKILLRT